MRGRGRSVYHHRVTDKSEEQVPTISVDYGFLGTKDSPATELPVLVGRDRHSMAVWASPVPHKGVAQSDHGVNRLRDWLNEAGYQRVIVKSDQEPSIKAVINAVKSSWPHEMVVEQAPKESHEKSNSEAEITVQHVHGLA